MKTAAAPNLKRVQQILDWPARMIVVGVVCSYRMTLKHFMGHCCRYTPSCSQYMLDSVAKYGPYRGTYRGIRRILRCHPWGGCGYDPA